MKRCIRCGSEIGYNYNVCPYCGQQQPMPNYYPKKKSNKGIIAAIILSLLIIIAFVVIFLLIINKNKDDNKEENNTIVDNNQIKEDYNYFETDEYTLSYDDNWTEETFDTGSIPRVLMYKDESLVLYPIGSSALDLTASESFSTASGKKKLYNDFYSYWSYDGDMQDGSDGFTKINDDIYYAYINYGKSKTDLLGQSFIIVSEKYNIVLTFQSQCKSNYSQYGDLASNIVKSIVITKGYVSNNNNNNNTDGKYVGTDEYGYVKVPNNWVKFNDIDGNSSFQYSDPSTKYIVSLYSYPTSQVSAYDFANSVYNKELTNKEMEGITSAKVTVNKYEAYQVYGYYPDSKTYLVMWFFEDGEGKTHYIALEGGEDLPDYLYIVDSFKLTN